MDTLFHALSSSVLAEAQDKTCCNDSVIKVSSFLMQFSFPMIMLIMIISLTVDLL